MKLIKVKQALVRQKRKDPLIDAVYTLNPYRGCSFSCLYCYANSERWRHRMQESFEVLVKWNLVEVLEKELKRILPSSVLIGSASDPYQKAEENFELTRKALSLLVKHFWKVSIWTKSRLVLRDVDLLRKARSAWVIVTVTTLRKELAKKLEPLAPDPEERLKVVEELSELGINTAVAQIPVFPRLTEGETQSIAKAFICGGLTLYEGVKQRFLKFLQDFEPGVVEFYERLYKASAYPPVSFERELSGKG